MIISTNASELAGRYDSRARRWDAALQAGLRKIAAQVERAQVANLSGGNSAAGSFPIPAPTGNLLRSAGSKVGTREALVFNTAGYAAAIEFGGLHAYGNPHAPIQEARPFLQRAADSVDHMAIMHDQLLEAIG